MQIQMQQQQMVQEQQLSDKQIAAQQQIADQQNQFNQQQLKSQQDLATQQQTAVDAQSQRQSTYDTGRAQALDQGTQQINDAFSKFTPDYFNNYASQYMGQVQNQLDYQKQQATKDLMFGMARQGLSRSQALASNQGLLTETEGRQLADQTTQAQNAADQLRANVAASKQNLLGQVTSAESVGSPIAASDMGGVNAALNTTRNAISGVTTGAGDVTASLQAQPTVGTLGNIFTGVLGNIGSYLSGGQANLAMANYNRAYGGGLSGTSPYGGSTTLK
jgi:hypothetical protein